MLNILYKCSYAKFGEINNRIIESTKKLTKKSTKKSLMNKI